MDTKELIKILKSSPSVLIRYAAERLQEQERIISSLSEKEEKPPALTILRRKQVEARSGLSCSSIYAKLNYSPKRPADYEPTFPAPISLGPKAVGWIEAEIEAWLTEQIKKGRKGHRAKND